MTRAIISGIIVFFLLAQSSLTDIPKTMSYQGLLTQTSGTPVADSSYNLTFNLYSTNSGGTPLWTENHLSVSVVKGIFNVILGSITPLNLLFDQQYWLGIQVGGTELTPRVKLTSVPYSFSALTVVDGAITTAKLFDNAVTADKIQPNIVSSIDGVSNDGGNIDLVPGSNVIITPNDTANTITIAVSDIWKLNGNAGTNPDIHFLGTTDNKALELKVNYTRALRLEPNAISPNIIGGFGGNSITPGVVGAVISGGGNASNKNLVTDNYSTIGGGTGNQVGNNNSSIDDAYYNTVGGGYNNKATGQYAFIGGGLGNEATALYCTVSGGGSNKATGSSATIAGGQNNQAVGGAFVGGGFNNNASIGNSTISGGEANTAKASYATIGGGRNNEAGGIYSIINGGRYNKTSANYATIGGGGTTVSHDSSTANRVTDEYGTVSGGGNNQAGDADVNSANKPYATVGGGMNNEASGAYSTVPGGRNNVAGGSYSFAAGRRAKASYSGCFVWGDSNDADIEAHGPNRFMVRSSGGVWFYSNSTQTTGVRLPANDSAWTTVSDKSLKENISPVNNREILSKLNQIPISQWNYKGQNPEIKHIGPMSQDFYAAFGLGDDERYISTIDPDGVALAAIQGLYEIVKEKDEKIAQLEARLAALEKLVSTGLEKE